MLNRDSSCSERLDDSGFWVWSISLRQISLEFSKYPISVVTDPGLITRKKNPNPPIMIYEQRTSSKES